MVVGAMTLLVVGFTSLVVGVTSLVVGAIASAGVASLRVGVTLPTLNGTSVEFAVTVIVRYRHVHFEVD